MSSWKNRTTAIAVFIAAAGFAGTACEKERGASVSAICAATCEQDEYCHPTGFAVTYESMSACREQCETELAETYDRFEPPMCLDAAMERDLCVAELSCYDLERDDLGDCDREIDTLQHCLAENQAHYDNTGACAAAEAALNTLDCFEGGFDLGCDAFADQPCDYTTYFACISDMYYCEDGVLAVDQSVMDECMQIAEAISEVCDPGDTGGQEGSDG